MGFNETLVCVERQSDRYGGDCKRVVLWPSIWLNGQRFGYLNGHDRNALGGHCPRVVLRGDGVWLVQCEECDKVRRERRPIGVGMPIASHAEAEAERIMMHHRKRAA